jgi:hypothetical protein
VRHICDGINVQQKLLSDYIPQMYQDATRMWFGLSGQTIQPNTLHFFASNFADGYARIGQAVYEMANGATGRKDLDPKIALLPFANFIGKKTSFDAKEYAEKKDDIESLKSSLAQVKHPT